MLPPISATRIAATHWGIVVAHPLSEGGYRLAPHPLDRHPSPNLDAILKHVQSSERITHPLVRRGWLTKREASRADRGRDDYVPVSWDTALSLAAHEITRTYSMYGPDAVFGRSYGWKSCGAVHSSASLVRRLLNACGGFIPTVNSYSTAAIAAVLPHVVGYADPPCPSWESVLSESQTVVFWGCDPIITNDVDWYTTLHEGSEALLSLPHRGIRTVAVNPVRPETAKLLGSDWIGIRAGSDVALVCALVHTLIEENRIDRAFLDQCTHGWANFADYVTGLTDGVEKSARWASDVTGLTEGAIRAFARRLASERVVIALGWGPQRARFGEQVPWALWALACALGLPGKPGCGIGSHYHYSDGGFDDPSHPSLCEIPTRTKACRFPSMNRRSTAPFPVMRFADMFLNPGKTIRFAGKTLTYPKVRLVVWAGGNPFSHQPDTFRVREAFRQPETVIVVDTMMTPTARHADIVLPACHSFERADITGIGTYSRRGIATMHPLFSPRGLSRPDYGIFAELAERLDVGEVFTEKLSAEGWMRRLFRETVELPSSGFGASLPDFDAFWQEGVLLFPKNAAKPDFWRQWREDGSSLPTPTGKIQITNEELGAMQCAGCGAHPRFFAPNSKEPGDTLTLVTVKSARRLHSQLDNVLDKSATQGLEICRIHPTDAQRLGIQEMNKVRLSNRQGTTAAVAHVTDDVTPGTVALSHGAWFKPAGEALKEMAGASNVLTPDEPTSELAWGNIAGGFAVRVAPCPTDS